MPTTDGYIGMFRVPEVGVTQPKITDISAATIAVTETTEVIGTTTQSIAKVDIGNVDLTEGTIVSVCIEHQLSTGTWTTTDITGSEIFPVSWTGADQGGTFMIHGVPHITAGLDSDFRAWFLNSDGEKAIDVATGKLVGVAPAAGAGYLQDDDVTFNGVIDLAEYPMVLDLIAVNASNTEGLASFTTPADIPVSGVIKLSWQNMKEATAKTGHQLASGATANISVTQWRTFQKYIVWMFVGATALPTTTYPWASETTGTWYTVGETANNFIEIDCPKNKKVCFCVACKMNLTAASATAPIAVPGYAVY